jgi:hypothetical protein
MKAICEQLDSHFAAIASRGLESQPDSRAVGAYAEQAIVDEWEEICAALGTKAHARPGRLTIYDASCSKGDQLIGIDIRTKDLDETRYADGGICSVANLLKLLLRDRGVLLIAEFSYREESNSIRFSDVKTAPIHCLPLDGFRIENLGTGQVRLDKSVVLSYEEIEWERGINEFVQPFAGLAIEHYERVSAKADERAQSLRRFTAGEELKLR